MLGHGRTYVIKINNSALHFTIRSSRFHVKSLTGPLYLCTVAIHYLDFKMRLRITAVGVAVASLATFSLSVALLAAGASPSTANDDYWVAVSAITHTFVH